MEYFYWYTHFVGKGSYWRDAFYPAPRRQFQQPRRRYYTHTSEPSELYLHVFDPYEAHIEPNIFHFPALKTLVFGTRVLSRRHSHLLMQPTPSLERLYLVNCFPAVLTDVGQLIWESGDVSEGHLKKYLPNLRQLLPRGDEYKGLLTEHAESIVRSGWLQGPWKNGPVCVELIWLPRWDNRRLEIQQLKQFLGSQLEVHGNVDISVRDISTPLSQSMSTSLCRSGMPGLIPKPIFAVRKEGRVV